MVVTHVLIIGASISGLACAASLRKEGIEYVIIDKEGRVAMPWRNHYERLHLHTSKNFSNLPYKKFDDGVPQYPSRLDVIHYLQEYQKKFDIQPLFNTEAKAIEKKDDYWITDTTNGVFRSKYLIMATGMFGKPKALRFNGMETFPGKILHSCGYKTGADFKGQKVLVIGYGNSACEIAIDLYEHGATPSMAVRSSVNIVPRDLFNVVPILRVSKIMSLLPVRMADAIINRTMRLVFGDITKLGFKKKSYGPLEQIRKEGNTPVLDIGTLKHIRNDHITIYGNLDHIANRTIHFSEGKKDDFDAIIAAIGYSRDYGEILNADKILFEDVRLPRGRQKYFGTDGLYLCGFRLGATGAIHEISSDARRIARDIAKR